ncbi:hypothetical protein PO909_027156 [Leuciscus waleckii]
MDNFITFFFILILFQKKKNALCSLKPMGRKKLNLHMKQTKPQLCPLFLARMSC